jgi:hypothetical protein
VSIHVECKKRGDDLYPLADGRYQLISGGEVAPFMSGRGYVLVERSLGQFLEERCLGSFNLRPVEIWRRRTNEIFKSHCELLFHSEITWEQCRKGLLHGNGVFLLHSQYVFVTPMLKESLIDAGFDYLEFNEHFSLDIA